MASKQRKPRPADAPKLRRKTDPKPPPPNRRHTVAEVMMALKKNANVPARAADALGITRQSLCERIANSDELKAFRLDLDGTVNDAARSIVLTEIIKKKSVKVAQWWLERRDPEFKNRSAVEARLPDDQIMLIVRGVSAAGGLKGLRDLREAMSTP